MKKMPLGDWRVKRKKDSREVAEAVGLSMSGYLNIEGGRRSPSRKTAQKIADCLMVRYDQIIWPIDASNCNISTGTCGQ